MMVQTRAITGRARLAPSGLKPIRVPLSRTLSLWTCPPRRNPSTACDGPAWDLWDLCPARGHKHQPEDRRQSDGALSISLGSGLPKQRLADEKEAVESLTGRENC